LTVQVTIASAGSSSVSIQGPNGQIEALGAGPLTVAALQIAGGDIQRHRIAQDELAGLLGTDPAPALADDHGQLRFVLDFFGLRRKLDGLAGSDDRAGRLHKQQRQLRYFGTVLGCVCGVVLAHAHDLAREQRRQQPDLLQRQSGRTAAELGEGRPLQGSDLVFRQPSPPGFGFGWGVKAQDAHAASLAAQVQGL
jgi:hypothetical protein